MKIQHVFRTLTVFILVLMSFAATQPAFAATVGTHHQMIVDMSWEEIYPSGSPYNLCNIDIKKTWSGYLRINYWLDELGLPTKEVDIAGTLKIMWSGTNGNVMNVQVAGPTIRHYEYLGDNKLLQTFMQVGAWDLVTIPHYGKVAGGGINIKLINTFDVTVPGNWVQIGETQVISEEGNWDPYNWEIICHYLGGEVK